MESNNKILSEEIEKFFLLSNYDTKKTLDENELSENDIFPEALETYGPGILRGDSNTKKGKLNFSGTINGVATYGVFKNKGFIQSLSKRELIGIRLASRAVRKGLYKTIVKNNNNDNKESDPGVISITINASVDDPFKFDEINLYPEAEESLKTFIDQLKSVPKTHGDDVYKKYLDFLRSEMPIYVKAYASKDGDPKQKVSGGYVKCNGYGKGTRGEYDQCLSDKRAEEIIRLIENEVPDYKGIFKPVGFGQTTKFNNKGWPDTQDREQTKPNRKFEISLPTYVHSKTTPTPNPVTPPKTNQTTQNKNKNKKEEENLYWKISDVFPSLPDGTTVKYRTDINSGYMLIKIDDLVKIFGSISELKNNLTLIGGGKFNDSIKTDVVVDKSGIKIYDTSGTFKWSNWNVPQYYDYDVTALRVTDFKPTATFTNGPEVIIKDVAFTLSTVPRRR